MGIFIAILNIVAAGLVLIGMAAFVFYFIKIVIHFFPLIRAIKDTRYYIFGPIIFFSDHFFLDKGKSHRKEFMRSGKRLLLISILLLIIGIYISKMKY